MYRPENYNITPIGRDRPTKQKFPFVLLLILILTGYLVWQFIPLGMVFLVMLPLISLVGYCIDFPLKSSRNLHSYLFVMVVITAIMVGINWKRQLSFLSKPFIEEKFQNKQVVREYNGTYYWEEVNQFVPKSQKEQNIMKVIELVLMSFIALAVLLSYFVDKWYNKKHPKIIL